MTLKWKLCREAEDDHKENERQYAHTFHYRDTICVCKAFWDLPQAYRDGILLHEIGHLLVGPEGSEREATEAAEKFFQVPIEYADSPYGQDLERIANMAVWIVQRYGQYYGEIEAPTQRSAIILAKKQYGGKGLTVTPKEYDPISERARNMARHGVRILNRQRVRIPNYDWADIGMSDVMKQGFMKRKVPGKFAEWQVITSGAIYATRNSKAEAEAVARRWATEHMYEPYPTVKKVMRSGYVYEKNPIKPGFSSDRRAIGTYVGQVGRPGGHFAFRGGRTLADAMAKAQAYADKFKEDVIVVDQVRGGYSRGTEETEVGRAYGWEPTPWYAGPPKVRPY